MLVLTENYKEKEKENQQIGKLIVESNRLTRTPSETNIKNNDKAPYLDFNYFSVGKIDIEKVDINIENNKFDNGNITFQNEDSLLNDDKIFSKLNNFDSFSNNNLYCYTNNISFSNNNLLYSKNCDNLLNTNGKKPTKENYYISSTAEKKYIFDSNRKFSDEENKILENTHQSPMKIKLGMQINYNDLSLYRNFLSSCKQNKEGKIIEISESEKKMNLELIDNLNFDINDKFLINDSILTTKFPEVENYALENKWEKILKEIEISHSQRIENSVLHSYLSPLGNDDTLKNINVCNFNNVNISKANETQLQNNINNSNIFSNFDPINHSLHSFYDINLDKEEFEKFSVLDSKEKQIWLKINKKEIYDLIINDLNNINNINNNKKNKNNFDYNKVSNLLGVNFLEKIKKRKRKNYSNTNLIASRKRKSLLEIHYCHINFDDNETYEGEQLDYNSTSISGYGLYSYKNGDSYEGDFVEGKRHGLGEYIYKDTSYYRGEWENDCKSGRGVYVKNGKEYNGIWKDNNFISGFIFEIKNLKVYEKNNTIKDKNENSLLINLSNNNNSYLECLENSNFSFEEEYFDLKQINDFFKDYGNERTNSNFSYAEFLQKYKVIQKEYFSNILMTNFNFLSQFKVETEIHLNDIIFNQKSIFKKFFNNSNLNKDDNIKLPNKNNLDKGNLNTSLNNTSNNDLSFSFAEQENLDKLYIEDLIFFSDCPLEETTHDFNKIYNLDFSVKCECKKIRNFISHFC